MISRISSFLAWRYLTTQQRSTPLTIMLRICFMSVALGAFALSLVMAIMNGFEKETHRKMQGVHADLIMRSSGSYLDDQAISNVLNHEFPEVAASSPHTISYAIIQAEGTNDIDTIISLRGINPHQEQLTSSLATKIIAPKTTKLAEITAHKQIIIGKKLAEQLIVSVGDTITLLYAQDEQINRNKVTFARQQVIVGGIFSLGIEEFDNAVAYCSQELIHTLFPDLGVTHINISLQPHADEQVIIKKIQERFHIATYSWKDLYPALVSALKLEKYAMFLIFLIISLVASMNIIALLYMKITQKRHDIAILQAMGMNHRSIKTIFVITGMLVAFLGAIIGLAAAYCTGYLLKTYPLITLPDVYYVSHLPVHLDLLWFITVFGAVMGISTIAILIALRTATSLNICEVLRSQ